MKLPKKLYDEIIDFLKSLPNLDDVNGRKAFLYSANLDPRLQEQISFDEPPAQFIPLLVSKLLNYGNLQDGRHALEAILEVSKTSIGQPKREYCEKLLRKLHLYVNMDSPDRSVVKEERFLDAAIAKKVVVNQKTELTIMIRLPDSKGLRKFLEDYQFFAAKREDVRSKPFELYFSVNEHITFLDLLISIEGKGFIIHKKQEKIRIYPSKDSDPYTFFVTPKQSGKLIITINIYSTEFINENLEEALIASTPIGIDSYTKFEEKISSLKTLVTFSLGTFGIVSKYKEVNNQDTLSSKLTQGQINCLIEQLKDNAHWHEAAEALIAVALIDMDEIILTALKQARKNGNWLLRRRIDSVIVEIENQQITSTIKEDEL